MTRSLRRFTVLALLGALVPATAFAQSDSDRATARQLGQDGEAALGTNEWKRAEDDFRRADALYHAPTLSVGLARAQAAQGKFVEAWENYHRVILDNATSSPAFAKALADAQREIGAIEGRRSRVTVAVTGADAPKVTIDDVPVRAEAVGVERFVDPGPHVFKATADGYLPATESLSIAEGATQTVTLTLQKDVSGAPLEAAPGAAGAPTSSSTGTEPAPSSSGARPARTLGFVAIGIGGAGLIDGIVTGVLALGKHSDLSKACTGGHCPPSESSDLNTYHTLGTLSTVGFIVGGVGLAAGTVLVLTARKSSPASTTGITISPYLGFGTAGATGTF